MKGEPTNPQRPQTRLQFFYLFLKRSKIDFLKANSRNKTKKKKLAPQKIVLKRVFKFFSQGRGSFKKGKKSHSGALPPTNSKSIVFKKDSPNNQKGKKNILIRGNCLPGTQKGGGNHFKKFLNPDVVQDIVGILFGLPISTNPRSFWRMGLTVPLFFKKLRSRLTFPI